LPSGKAFDQNRPADHIWNVLPDADHGLYMRNEAAKENQRHLSPGFIDLTTEWLVKGVTVKNDY